MEQLISHHPNSVLAFLGRHTAVDIDCNDAAVAVKHNAAAKALADDNAALASLFGDMTSNQLIVLGMANELANAGDELMVASAREARELLTTRQDMAALALGQGGLGDEEKKSMVQQFVVDVFTVKLGLLMLPHLREFGHVHAQTITSKAYATTHTIAHARRLVALYKILGNVPRHRVCIKIPSTVEGLRAMQVLESEGICTLATTVFCVEQGLAAAESAKTLYIAPYINALEAHMYDRDDLPPDRRRFGADSVNESIFMIQRLQRLLAKPSRRERYHYTTEVMGASFLSISEIVRLTGMNRMTLSPAMIEQLATTSLDDQADDGKTWKDIALTALQGFQPTEEDDPFEGAEGDWLGANSFDGKDQLLRKALCEYRVCEMLKDALSRFTAAEVQLKRLAETALTI